VTLLIGFFEIWIDGIFSFAKYVVLSID